MRKIVFLGVLLLAAGWDFKRQEIPLWVFGLGGLLALPIWIYEILALQKAIHTTELALGMGVGAALLLLSVFSREAVGKGDGVFFLISGLYLEYRENYFLFFSGLLFCSLYCLGLGVWGQLRNKRTWSQHVAFLPFLVPAGIWLVINAGGV